MHRLSRIEIENFRSCRNVKLSLENFTSIIGYNNAGKSNILTAIEWFNGPSALSREDFHDPAKPLRIAGDISGISDDLLGQMVDNQRAAISPYVREGMLQLRRVMPQPGAATIVRTEVRDPAVMQETDVKAWVAAPTGIPQALKALFPETIRVQAMQKAGDDVGKASKSNTIGKLIAEIIEPIRKDHEQDLKTALDVIASKLSVDGTQRAQKLNEFDAGTSAQLAELFPGLKIKLDIPLPEIPELFKNGNVRVLEIHGDNAVPRSFDSVGHGAQRCIQMALIRYLAETKAGQSGGKRTLLLIDEPELYLHPQGTEQVRRALKMLSNGGYQVIFTTHSPLMLHHEDACYAVIVRKLDSLQGTIVRKPLVMAVRDAIADAPHQTRVLFELGKAAEVFFSDRLLISEGKTEDRLLPLLFERLHGRTARASKLGMLSIGSCSDLVPALKVLKSMEIEGKAVADLDFAFVEAGKAGLIDRHQDPEVIKAKKLLAVLQSTHGFSLETNGFPKSDPKTEWIAARVWALFANDVTGAKIAAAQRAKLQALGVWVWAEGTLEDVLGTTDKGEEAIQTLEHKILTNSPDHLALMYPAVVEMFKWANS